MFFGNWLGRSVGGFFGAMEQEELPTPVSRARKIKPPRGRRNNLYNVLANDENDAMTIIQSLFATGAFDG